MTAPTPLLKALDVVVAAVAADSVVDLRRNATRYGDKWTAVDSYG